MTLRSLTLLVLAQVVAVGWGYRESAAGSITGRNATTNTVVFSDNGFEDDTAGSPPNAPATGSWTAIQGIGTGVDVATPFPALVTNDVSPGPNDGLNYFIVNRPSNNNSQRPLLIANLASPVTGSDILAFSFAFQRGTGSLQMILADSVGNAIANVTSNTGAGAWNLFNGAFSVGGATALPNSGSFWQDVTLRYAADGSLYELTVDGQTALFSGTPTSGPLGRIEFRTNGIGSWYIDGIVPEPSSIVLLGLGIGGVMLRSRRRMS